MPFWFQHRTGIQGILPLYIFDSSSFRIMFSSEFSDLSYVEVEGSLHDASAEAEVKFKGLESDPYLQLVNGAHKGTSGQGYLDPWI